MQSRGFIIGAVFKHLVEAGICEKKFFEEFEELFGGFRQGRFDYTTGAVSAVPVFGKALAGKNCSEMEFETTKFLQNYLQQAVFPFSKELVGILCSEKNGGKGLVLLLSGSPDFSILHAARFLGASGFVATEYEERQGVFTGGVVQNLVTPGTKTRLLKQKISDLEKEFVVERGLAGGDSEEDMKMALENDLMPVAFGPRLKDFAEQKGFVHVPTVGGASAKQIISKIHRLAGA